MWWGSMLHYEFNHHLGGGYYVCKLLVQSVERSPCKQTVPVRARCWLHSFLTLRRTLQLQLCTAEQSVLII